MPDVGSKGEDMTTDEQYVDALDEAQEVIPFTYSIASYGADYPVDSLVKRITNKDILVPTFEHEDDLADDVDAFQREYVWQRPKADRFIESLLLGLPVPGIFLVKEDTGRLLVLDGHQRLHTLERFYSGVIHGIEYRLDGIQERFVGKTYKGLDVEDRRRLDDSIIHATIVKQEQPSEFDLSRKKILLPTAFTAERLLKKWCILRGRIDKRFIFFFYFK